MTGRPRSAIVRLESGELVELTGRGILGRAPTSEPGEFVDSLVRIDDPGRSVSKSHLEFGVDGNGVWMLDRFSANGSVHVPVEGAERALPPGMRVAIGVGDRLRFGDTWLELVALE